MNYTFDVYKKLSDGSPRRVASVQGLAEAEKRMVATAQISPGQYFICAQEVEVVAERENSPEWAEVT